MVERQTPLCKRYPLGIHFGTEIICMSVYKDGRAQVISINGKQVIPSVVGYNPDSEEILVGDAALLMSEQNPDNTIFNFIYLLGH